MERAPRPQFEKDNKKLSQAWEAGLKRRGIEPPAERTKLPQEEKGDVKSRYDIAAERAAKIKTEEPEMKPEPTPTPSADMEKEILVRPEGRRDTETGRLKMLLGKTGRLMRIATLAMLGLTAAQGVKTPEAIGATGPTIAAPKDAIPMKESKKESSEHKTKWPGYIGRLFETDKKGEIHLNPGFIIAPVEFVWKGEMRHKMQRTTTVPYELARQFAADKDAKKPLRPEDHKKIAAHLEQDLKKRFVDTIGGWAGSEGVQRFNYGEPQTRPQEIKEIKITGYASFEGPRSRGPSTILGTDKENIELAKERARAALSYTKEDLKEVSKATGIAMGVLERTLQNVSGIEEPLSDKELKELASLASAGSYKGIDDLEKIWKMIGDYNDKKIKDPQLLSRLHDIVGSKRRVEITVTYDGKNEERTSLPISWIPFLLLAPLMRRRREEPDTTFTEIPPHIQEMRGIGRGEKPTAPQPAASEKEPNAKDLERTRLLEQIHRGVIDTRLPERGTRKFEEMEEATCTDDLYMFFDDPESIRLGIDYRAMADGLDQKWDIFKTSDERENYLANEILNSWKKKDRLCRQEAGVSEDQLDAGLDYENQPRQIQWAKMHARSLLRVVDKRKELRESEIRKPSDYLDLLSPQVKKMIQRRGSR